MRWSWRIGRIAGIGVYLHATFALLLGWVALGHVFAGQTALGVLGALLFTLSVFAVVVLHELGHALMARRFGIRTRDITLLPIGGVARLERLPDSPRQELLVALAGPAVNVALALVLFVALRVLDIPALAPLDAIGGSFLARLMWVNVSLAIFNLLPAFPMDGGRVLRAGLAMRLGSLQATRIAARVGKGMAVLLALAGLFLSPVLLLIAMFVWFGASRELQAAEQQAAARDAWLPPGWAREPRIQPPARDGWLAPVRVADDGRVVVVVLGGPRARR